MSRFAAPFVALVAILAFLAQCYFFWAYTMDDAFITFRYSKHLAEGSGPIWNLADADDPVEGFTSFLHVFLLAGLHFITGADLYVVAKLLGLFCVFCLALFLSVLGLRSGFGVLAMITLMSPFALPFTAANAVSGMETGLYALVLGLLVLSAARLIDRPVPRNANLFVVLGLLATLTRPEIAAPFLVLAAVIFLIRSNLRWPLAISLLLLFVIPGIALTIWRFAYYGAVLPQPFFVKQAVVAGRGLRDGDIYVLRFLILVAAPYLIVTLAYWRQLVLAHRSLLISSSVVFVLTVIYFLTVAPLMGWYFRYLLPQVPVLAMLAACALNARRNVSTGVGVPVFAAGYLALVVALYLPMFWNWLPAHYQHEIRYREIGRRLAPFASEGLWLSFNDVGALIYESEWNTIDMVGLNTRLDDTGRDICRRRENLVLRIGLFPEGFPNPCPHEPGLYEKLAVLPLMELPDGDISAMTVFARSDLEIKEQLSASLRENWPEAHRVPDDWVTRYQNRMTRPLWE